MDDAEVICTWMEPRPPDGVMKLAHWWYWVFENSCWIPQWLTLDRLHQVEARLTDEQWLDYQTRLNRAGDPGVLWCKRMIGASAEHKTLALAAILRPLVAMERGAEELQHG
jgi:hypothetical protein